MNPTYKNKLLKALDPESIQRLALQPIVWDVMDEIEFPGTEISRLFFLEEGMASMTTTFKDGSQVEAGMFGYESVIGVSALMGTRRSLNRVYTQIAGKGYFCTLRAAVHEFDRGETFNELCLRSVQAQLVQAIQSIGCNRKHTMEQRLARWLLICADRTNSRHFAMSQEFLSDMLGCARPALSETAGKLKAASLIEYKRGLIEILNVPGLELRSCECYQVVKAHLDNCSDFAGSEEK
jgi:CRP-like cAMP-binding protein